MLTTLPYDAILDMPDWVGQRVSRFTFRWINGLTNQTLGWLTPERDPPPTITHNTTRSIKRDLTLNLGTFDTSQVNARTDRVLPYVTINGVTWPLGRYMFTNETDAESSVGNRGVFRLLDEGWIIEQELTLGFYSSATVDLAVFDLLTGLPLVGVDIASTNFLATGGFNVGTNRGRILDAYATQGDYFPYWLNNAGVVRMIRTIDPAGAVPDFDLDAGNRVRRSPAPALTSDVLLAPNRFVVRSNSGDALASEIIGVYDVPPSAPHSIAQRGFVIQQTDDIQLKNATQATAAARNLGLRQTIFERVTLTTAVDPRHDSYNVVHYRGANWLEIAWALECIPGGAMEHTLRKSYT